MMWNDRRKHGVWPLLAVLLAAGCGGRPPVPEREEEPASTVTQSVEVGGSVIQMASPKGAWEFEARSEHAEAASMEGPYLLTPMEGWYKKKDGSVVVMGADRAEVDKGAEKVTLEGSVWVDFGGARLEAERVEYDLRTGKVVAEGQTKWTLTEERRKPGTGEPVRKEGES